MSDKNKPAQVASLKATITIQQFPEGLAIGLDLGGEKLNIQDPKGIASLALVGVDAMRDYIRDNFKVKGELVEDNTQHKKATTH